MSFRAPFYANKIKLDTLESQSQYSINLDRVSSNGTPMMRNHSNSQLSNTPSGVYVREQLSQFQHKQNKYKKLNEFSTSICSSPTYFQNFTSTHHQQNILSTTASNSNQNSDKKPFFKSPNLMQRQISSASKVVTVSTVQNKGRGNSKQIQIINQDETQSIGKLKMKQGQQSENDSQQESFFTKEQKQKLNKLKQMYKTLQYQQEAEQEQTKLLQDELNQQVSGDQKVFFGNSQAVHEFEIQLEKGEHPPIYSQSPTLNKRINLLRTQFTPDAIMNPQQLMQQIHNQSYTPYESIKKNRIQNAKLYRNVVSSMNKQIKPVSKEFEELKYKLNGKHTEKIEKILLKLSIINIDKNQKLKTNANNEIVFDKMMQEICKQREKVTKHTLAKHKVKQRLLEEDQKINYVNIPNYDHTSKLDFFKITNAAIKQYRKNPQDLNQILTIYQEGQDQLMELLKDHNDENNLFDIKNLHEGEIDPFFTNPYLKEIMCKHLIFRKGNQKIDFFGAREIKKRTIYDILNRFNHPSECSSEFDSEQSFYYLPSSEQQINIGK